MMILDLSAVSYAVIAMEVGFNEGAGLSVDLVRHMILNSVRRNYSKFKNQYGTLVIACDSSAYWRKEVFPYYKAHRKKKRDESGLDWRAVHQALNLIKGEFAENLPYPTILVEGAEADDVIYTLACRQSTNEPVLIISPDTDFIQIQKLPAVSQWDPVRDRVVRDANPVNHLLEKIIKGDSGDGIPNVLSDDDTFVTDKRQRPLTARRLEEMKVALPRGLGETRVVRNYHRNEHLIDLSRSSQSLRDMIWSAYQVQMLHGEKIGRSRLLPYFSQHRLRKHMEALSEF